MKTFAAIVALSAILLVGVHTAFAGGANDFEGMDKDAPAALYLPGADTQTLIVSDSGRTDAEPLEAREEIEDVE